MHVEGSLALFCPVAANDAICARLRGTLAAAGITVSREDALALAARREEILLELERVEFGQPAVLSLAEALAGSPHLAYADAADTLSRLQDGFYALRDELPVDVPDAEIVEALLGCLDELGDAAELAATPADEVMAHSPAYVSAREAEEAMAYRIVDDEGRTYSFGPTEWEYDEFAPGWDGERWSDDWDG